MKSWVLAAGLLVAVASPPALAADMDDGTHPPYSNGGDWDERRYPPKTPPPETFDDDEDDLNGPPNEYSRVPPPADKYSRIPPPYKRPPPEKYADVPYKGKCVRSEEVREGLTGRGWRDFHAGAQVNDNLVTLRARRPNGRLFELTLHRCSGQIVDARPLEPRRREYAWHGPYDGPGRWGPYYERPWFGPYGNSWLRRRWYRDDD
jgi:hypothetical protein